MAEIIGSEYSAATSSTGEPLSSFEAKLNLYSPMARVMLPAQCRGARAMLEWSQAELARQADLPIQTIARFENSTIMPREDVLMIIRLTFEKEGIEFITLSGGGIGVLRRC